MKVVFATNFVHHHQIPLADELYNIVGNDYYYIAVNALPDWLIKGGYDPAITRPYIVRSYVDTKSLLFAQQLINDADVVIIGSVPESMVEQRLTEGKLTFRYEERLFKKRPWYFPDPRVWKRLWKQHIQYKRKPVYVLAASAYTANDVYAIGAYKDKTYKWGYFPAVDTVQSETASDVPLDRTVSILWCARFLSWKHPELPIKLARRLKNDGYDFKIDMIGSGEQYTSATAFAKKLNVEDKISFLGNMPNAEVIKSMNRHDIFLFTSDKNEGWGAVLNEAMSQGCAVVASNKIGAAPFLVKDGENGLIFKSGSIDSLYAQCKRLIDDRQLRAKLAHNAVRTMQTMWSPQNAAQRFITLAARLLDGKDTIYTDGPCSKAYPYKD